MDSPEYNMRRATALKVENSSKHEKEQKEKKKKRQKDPLPQKMKTNKQTKKKNGT